MNQIEILSPAGSMESIKAAIAADCDAIYIGGTMFGARAFANNLTEDEMLRAIDQVHLHGKKIYLTVNTLLKENEVQNELISFIQPFYQQGLDAVIVQDVGVLRVLYQNFPGMDLHASTQMTLTMAEGANQLKDYGVTRIVPARELTMQELRTMRAHTDLELEVFVQGALCYSYSGQCLMSSMIGGRSGNRGKCAQPCRKPYTLQKNGVVLSHAAKPYVLSPKDLCTIPLIPDLVEAGVNSFKIEGRMKRPEYCAWTTHLYRKYTDYYMEYGKDKYKEWMDGNPKELQQDMLRLKDLYNRGSFTKGYFYSTEDMLSDIRPNHNGVKVGKVKAVKGIRAEIGLSEEIFAQDVMEFRNQNGSILYEYTVKTGVDMGGVTETNFTPGTKIKVNDEVYRTKNQNLLTEIHNTYLEKERKIPIKGHLRAFLGEKISYSLNAGETEIKICGEVVQEAKNQPMSQEQIEKCLKKTGDSPYVMEDILIDKSAHIFVSVGQLNTLRREALIMLEEEQLIRFKRKKGKSHDSLPPVNMEKQSYKSSSRIEVAVSIHTLEQLSVAIDIPEVDRFYLPTEELGWENIESAMSMLEVRGKKAFLQLPTIFRKETYAAYSKKFERGMSWLESTALAGYLIANFEEVDFVNVIADKKGSKERILNHNMYVMNLSAHRFWAEKGIYHVTLPLECKESEWNPLIDENTDILVYGHIPVMTTANCLLKNTIGCTKKKDNYILKDSYNNEYYMENNCNSCYNIIYHYEPISLLKNCEKIQNLMPSAIRLDFTVESTQETKRILNQFVREFVHNKVCNKRR